MLKRAWRLGLSLLLAAALTACAVAPHRDTAQTRSDALLAELITQARQQLAGDPRPHLLFAGLAMDDRSTAFRNDVLLAEAVALQIDPKAVVFKLANPAPGQRADLPSMQFSPLATRHNIETVLATIGRLARPQDKVMLLISTHGAPGLLSLHASNAAPSLVSTAEISRWLAPLGDRPTLLVISACYSGSFIEPLQQAHRVILTAAAKDRNSFGCQSLSDNTFFTKALLRQPMLLGQSMRELMQNALRGVAELETQMRLTPPSLPQSFYGAGVEAWSKQPLSEWLLNVNAAGS